MQPEPNIRRIINSFAAPIPLSGVIEHDTGLRRQQVGHVTCHPTPPFRLPLPTRRHQQQQRRHRLRFFFFSSPCFVTLEITRCDCRRPPHAGAVPELVWSACRVRVHVCACACVLARVCAGNKGIIVGCRCVLVPGRLQRRIRRTMALCSSTHLSQRGEVRGPDRWKITKEQTSLNPRGGTEG